MNNSNDGLKIFGALVVGTITGAALGILFAPNKGSITRSRILGGANDMVNDLSRLMKDEVNLLKNKAEEVVGFVDEKGMELQQEVDYRTETFNSVV